MSLVGKLCEECGDSAEFEIKDPIYDCSGFICKSCAPSWVSGVLCECGKKAVWFFAPKDGINCCDDCVPRGCFCQDDYIGPDDPTEDEFNDSKNWKKSTDEQGRLIPCIEWFELQ